MKKRIFSLLLAFAMLATTIPSAVFATQTGQQPVQTTNDVSIEGTNGFGNLLSSELVNEWEQQQAEEQTGYCVSGLTFEGNTALAEVFTLEDAKLVVSVYTEDGLQMLNSAVADVSAEDSEVLVTFEGEMPEYFMASAYLVDSYALIRLITVVLVCKDVTRFC